MKINVLVLFFSLALLCVACTEEPPPTLNYKDRQLVDSLFKLQVDSLRPRYDSICNAQFDSLVKHHTDSMMDARMKEIEKYLQRIKQGNNQ
jgi:hypothetical protein